MVGSNYSLPSASPPPLLELIREIAEDLFRLDGSPNKKGLMSFFGMNEGWVAGRHENLLCDLE